MVEHKGSNRNVAWHLNCCDHVRPPCAGHTLAALSYFLKLKKKIIRVLMELLLASVNLVVWCMAIIDLDLNCFSCLGVTVKHI